MPTSFDPSWPAWLVVVVVFFAFAFPALAGVLVAKINQQKKTLEAQEKKTDEVHQHVVNSHGSTNLRADIDVLKGGIARLNLLMRDLGETQKAHSHSLDRRYDLQQKALEDAVEDGRRAMKEIEEKQNQRIKEQDMIIKAIVAKFALDHPEPVQILKEADDEHPG